MRDRTTTYHPWGVLHIHGDRESWTIRALWRRRPGASFTAWLCSDASPFRYIHGMGCEGNPGRTFAGPPEIIRRTRRHVLVVQGGGLDV